MRIPAQTRSETRFPGNLELLMEGYQRGENADAAALIQCLNPLLLRFFLGQYGNRAEAEDLVQDTWLRIHQARHTYRSGEPLLPWIYAIARHAGVDGFRRSSRVRVREINVPSLPEAAAGPDLSQQPESGSFNVLLAALPPGQREVVAMLKGSGMSLDEVARATSSSVGAVKLKAHRAYEKLRDLLRPLPASRLGKDVASDL